MDEKDIIKKLEEARLPGIQAPAKAAKVKALLMKAAAQKTRVSAPLYLKFLPAAAAVFALFVMTVYVIDNMDEGKQFNKKGGYWSTYTDRHENGNSEVWPPESGGFTMSQPGYGGNGYAVKITGKTGPALGLNYNYLGVVVRLDSKSQCPACQGTDIKKYTGIRFKIKGSLAGGRVYVILPHESNECLQERLTCRSLTDYADYQADITKYVTPDWKIVMIDFKNDMSQPGWTPGKNMVDISAVLGNVHLFNWQYKNGNGGEMEMWLDDVELY